jgi:SAM-dependent methyltransferase
MNAVVRPRPPATLAVAETREFRAYHEFLRAARNHMEGALVAEAHEAYEREIAARGIQPPAGWREAEEILDGLWPFRFYCWCFRNLQRFKYHRPSLGIFAVAQSQRARLEAGLADSALVGAPGTLRLDPGLEVPDYFRMVPFHQHTGGVAHDPLDGLCYELGRRTTVPSHADPNGIYRIVFEQLPPGPYRRVLDWGTGHGAGLVTWQAMHPESECHGVDLSAPCLRLAHRRAFEQGMTLYFSQQDLEHLDYPDGHFDLVFFNFMLHELPPTHLPALLREAARITAPGGLFAGAEFHLRPDDPFQNVLQRSHAWLNNETYATPWYDAPVAQLALEAGFSAIDIAPFERLNRSVPLARGGQVSGNYWNFYLFRR